MNQENLTVLFFGDIVGRLGRQAMNRVVREWKDKHSADFVFANGENMAHGKGVTPTTIAEVLAAGVDYITTGDHCFDQGSSVQDCYEKDLPILRPANYAPGAPGKGYVIIPSPKGDVLLINLIGRSFMSRNYECPFRAADAILAGFTDKKFSAIIIDIHAETTAEKIALRHYLDGRISALVGTHTHVPTADESISPKGTGYITDLGMNGDADGVIGVTAAPIIASFLTQTKVPHELAASGRTQINALKLVINSVNGSCVSIEPLREIITITL
jgi:metallophosphoesterase (TIGR00282 family)